VKLDFDLSFDEAIEYFNAKKPLPTQRWDDLKAEAHAKAFTVAKAMKLDLLNEFQSSLSGAMKDGKPFAQWKKEIEPTLAKHGWLGVKKETIADGTEKVTQLGTPRRLKTIFQTNIQSSYMAGRWSQIEETKSIFPYLMYDAKQDGLTRPTHRALDGKVFAVDDPFWDSQYPPNGYNCRCSVVQLRAKDLQKLGKSVEAPESVSDVERTNKKTGEIYKTTAYRLKDKNGIEFISTPDPMWDVNVGKSRLWDRNGALDDCYNVGLDFAEQGGCLKTVKGQKSWKDYGREDIKNVSPDKMLPLAGILDSKDNKKEAIEQLKDSLGLSKTKQIEVVSPLETIIINEEYLEHIVEKRDARRERYANFIIPSLLNPFEIWATLYEDGNLRRRYIAIFEDVAKKAKHQPTTMSIIRINKDGSLLWNFIKTDAEKMNANREGILLYGR